MKQIGLAITHFNRFRLLRECFVSILADPRIGEVVISDDASTDGSYEQLMEEYHRETKVKIFRNPINQDCHRNKGQAMRRSTMEWVVLFDSDNVILRNYLDILFSLPPWDKDVAYCPSFAKPHFDYREFEGVEVTRKNVAGLAENTTFLTALNTCNYFIHRESYLETWDGSVDPHTADSIYQNYRWLAAGKRLVLVPGLHYFHRVHDQSHFKLNHRKTGKFAEEVVRRIKELK